MCAPAFAGPVATSDSQYQGLGAVFPDPLAGCQNASGAPACDPAAEGNVAAKSFISYGEFVNAILYMNQDKDWQRYMEVWPLDGKLDDPSATTNKSGNARSDVPGNNLPASQLEFEPKARYQSAGLPRPDLSRLKADLIVVRVTDESVPDDLKKRYALSLSIHGIERAGAEGGVRAMEDLVTAVTTKRLDQPIVSKAVKPGAPRFRDVLQNTIIYFTFPNPDGWRRGSFSTFDAQQSGFFFQRYNGNGVDVNRDWPDIGFSYRFYSGLSEPESQSFSEFYGEVRRKGGAFAAGDDLHGQPEADALSYTLLPHGRHSYGKDLRIREAAKRINRAQYEGTKWSPIIQDNDKPRGGGPPCVPGELGDVCSQIYAQTWGSVYDTINYTTTGALGDWFDSALGLHADGIDNEMSFSHLDKNITFEPQTEQLHVAGNKAIIYSHLTEMLDPPSGRFDAPGAKGYVPNKRLHRDEQSNQPGPPEGSVAQAPIDDGPTDTVEFKVKTGAQTTKGDTSADAGKNIFNGGLRVQATAPNVQGISSGETSLTIQCKGCDRHRDQTDTPSSEEWVTVAQDFNQSALYAQAGVTVAVNAPQGGDAVTWRAVVATAGGPARANFHIEFTQGPATTGGNTGGGPAPKLLAYDIANTDFMKDLNEFIDKDEDKFKEVDPAKVIAGDQSLTGLKNLVLADDPLPGFTGLYGAVGAVPKDFDITADPTAPGAYSPNLVDDPSTRRPGTYTSKEFTIKPDESAGGVHIRIEWTDANMDFDMYLYRSIGDKQILVGESATAGGDSTFEDINLNTPLRPGKYQLIVDNWAAPDFRWDGKVQFKSVDPNPPSGDFTPEQRDAWFAKLKEFVEGGGNLILTDGALRALPALTGMPSGAVGPSTVYAGQVSFETAPGETTLKDPLLNAPQTINQPGSRFNSDTRRQMYEPTPLGFPIQTLDRSGSDASFARQWDIDRAAFEKVPGARIVGTSADPGARDARAVHDQVALGEVKLGSGQIRFVGGLLPQATEAYDHEFGLEPYAVTYSGYILFRNLLATAEEQAKGTVAGVTYAASSKRKPRFLISNRLVRMTLKGTIPVRVSCRATGGCRGTLLIERGKHVIGKKKFRVKSKRRTVIKVRLRPAARSSVRRRPRTRVAAEAAVAYSDGRRETVGPVRFRISRPKG
ncbi:MAG: hypothetical protein QOJ29_5266 [Thermoleophilaceae bacterium]|nr:hypothetical protein [Thermoleophilaceae bacterium]